MLKKCIAVVSLFLTTQVYAWNAVGHELVAQIAYERLNPAVQAKVDTIVKDLAHDYPNIHSFIDIAPWPDNLRGQGIELYSHWHYYDQAFSTDNSPLKNLADTDNVEYALHLIEPIIKNNQTNPYEKARFLAFLVHLVGDIHQPLHASALISKEHPNGDLGGNAYHVYAKEGDANPINLHKEWDEGCGLFTDSSDKGIKQLSQKIETDYPESYFVNQAENLKINDWAAESFQLAKDYVYTTDENKVLSQQYISVGQQDSEQRVALAGYRLANLLNQLLA